MSKETLSSLSVAKKCSPRYSWTYQLVMLTMNNAPNRSRPRTKQSCCTVPLSIGFLRFPLRFIYGQVPLPLLATHARRPFQAFPRRCRARRRPMTKYIFLSTSRSYSITLLPALSTNAGRAKHASRALALQFHPCKARPADFPTAAEGRSCAAVLLRILHYSISSSFRRGKILHARRQSDKPAAAHHKLLCSHLLWSSLRIWS